MRLTHPRILLSPGDFLPVVIQGTNDVLHSPVLIGLAVETKEVTQCQTFDVQ